MVTVRDKIITTLHINKESMSSEDIFLYIRAKIDTGIRMLTVERVLYSLIHDGTFIRSGNVYSLKRGSTEMLVWLEENYE